MRKTSLPSRNLCISTLVSWLSTLPRHTGKCLTWILLLPRHPTWILHLLRWRRGSFIFLVTQEVHNVDNTYILVANVDSIVSSSHRNCTTWIFEHPRCRRGYSKFLVIQKYRDVDIYKFLVAVVDIIGSSSHKNLVTWIFQLPRHGRGYLDFRTVFSHRFFYNTHHGHPSEEPSHTARGFA